MTYQGRSRDDLPLAAYTTGAAADEPEDEVDPDTSHLSQQDVVAMAMGIQPAAPETAASTAEAPKPRARRSLPRPSLPRPSVPRPSVRLPKLGGRGRAAIAAEVPFRVTAQAAPAGAQAAQMAAPAVFAMPLVQAPAARPVTVGRSGVRAPKAGGLGASLRSPRTAVRDPRVLLGAVIALGIVVVGAGMLGAGGSTGGILPGASASAAPGVGVPTVPGSASIEVAGDFTATFALTGTAAVGKPADGQLVATWDDAAGSSVALTGRVSSGMRTTAAELTLAIIVIRNGVPVTFTSAAGECTVGMAQKLVNVTGSFVCPEITSEGGRFTVKLSGKFTT